MEVWSLVYKVTEWWVYYLAHTKKLFAYWHYKKLEIFKIFQHSDVRSVSRIHKTYLMDQKLFCWRHFCKIEVVQNTDLNILAL